MIPTFIRADARHIPLADETVHTVITSPPYWGLRDYELEASVWGAEEGCRHEWGEEGRITSSPHNGLPDAGANSPEAMRKCLEKRSYEASTGSFCLHCKAWRGSLGMEPMPALYIEHLVGIFREVRRVLRKDGTLWLNMGDSYAATGKSGGGKQGERWTNYGADHTGPRGGKWSPAPPDLKPKDLVGIPWMLAFALRDDGWYLRSEIIWHKPNPMPESVKDRPTRAHEQIFLLSKSARYYYDGDAIREEFSKNKIGWLESGSGKTCFGLDGVCNPGDEMKPSSTLGGRPNENGRNKRTVWTVSTQGYGGGHFATFNPELITPCILAGAPKGGIVLDPFSGSGTVAWTAARLGRRGIGTDLGYQDLSRRNRLSEKIAPKRKQENQGGLFECSTN